jgi:hypothetical protein
VSADVHRLTGAGPIIEPVAPVIARLRQMLAEAEAGEIKGIGYFTVRGNDAIRTGWVSGCADRVQMLAGGRLLDYRVVKATDDDS